MPVSRLAAAVAAVMWTVVAAVALTFPALTGRIVDQANVIPAETRSAIEPKLADLEAKSGIQLVVATVNSLEGQEIEPYANALFRAVEAWREGQEQRRTAAGRAKGAAGSHRGRLRPRRHADRCARQGHHHQRDHAPIQGRRLQRRHFSRRRRHHHGAHHRCIRVGEAPVIAAGQSAGQRSGQLDHHADRHRRHRAADRFARIPLVLLQRRAEYPVEFGQFAEAAAGRSAAAEAAADFPEAGVRQAAAARRGAGDETFRQKIANEFPRRSAPPRPKPRARSSAFWRSPRSSATALPMLLAR